MTNEQPKRGRGRPAIADPKINYTARLAPDVFRFLRQVPHQAEFIEATVRKSKEYRAWLAEQSN